LARTAAWDLDLQTLTTGSVVFGASSIDSPGDARPGIGSCGWKGGGSGLEAVGERLVGDFEESLIWPGSRRDFTVFAKLRGALGERLVGDFEESLIWPGTRRDFTAFAKLREPRACLGLFVGLGDLASTNPE